MTDGRGERREERWERREERGEMSCLIISNFSIIK